MPDQPVPAGDVRRELRQHRAEPGRSDHLFVPASGRGGDIGSPSRLPPAPNAPDTIGRREQRRVDDRPVVVQAVHQGLDRSVPGAQAALGAPDRDHHDGRQVLRLPVFFQSLGFLVQRVEERGRASFGNDAAQRIGELDPIRGVLDQELRPSPHGRDGHLDVCRETLEKEPQALAHIRHCGVTLRCVVDEYGHPHRPLERLDLEDFTRHFVPLNDDLVGRHVPDRSAFGVGERHEERLLLGRRHLDHAPRRAARDEADHKGRLDKPAATTNCPGARHRATWGPRSSMIPVAARRA